MDVDYTIMQAPTTVNNNAWIIVNQSIMLPKSQKRNPNESFEQYKKKDPYYTAFCSKKGSKDGLRSKSRKGGSSKKRSPKGMI